MASRALIDTIGIDFGTSTTLVATRNGAVSVAMPIGEGANPWVPSVVGLDGGQLVAGERAEQLPPNQRARSAKRLLTAGLETVTIGDAEVPTEDAVRAILTESIGRASKQGADFDGASRVQLGCPAMWRAPQRQLLRRIAQECGVDVHLGDIIDEPISAGVAWIQDRGRAGAIPTSKVLIFDPGGGTLDAALLQVKEHDGSPEITVLAADGVDESGDALDESIASLLRARHAAELSNLDPPAVVQVLLGDRARQLKEALSDVERERLALGASYDLVLELDRRTLEGVFAGQCGRAMRLVESVVRASKLREQQTLSVSSIRALPWTNAADGVGHVVLVGGLSRVPFISHELRRLFPDAELHTLERPQEAVVRGLVFSEEFERLNLHRPAFSFDVAFQDRFRRPIGPTHRVYDAFTPLYERNDLFRLQSHLGYTARVPDVPPGAAYVELQCRSIDGHPIVLDVDGVKQQTVSVHAAGRTPVTFKLYVNGDIVFGPNGIMKMRVRSWPTLRGDHHRWTLGLQTEVRSYPQGDERDVHAHSTRRR
jgi:molecular chaperone DnaK (HSP70)